MIYHDKWHALSWNVTKFHHMSWIVTKYHHMSWNITMFHFECYHPDVIKCHEMSFNLTWGHLMTCHDVVNLIQEEDTHSSLLLIWEGYPIFVYRFAMSIYFFCMHSFIRTLSFIDQFSRPYWLVFFTLVALELLLCFCLRQRIHKLTLGW